MNFTERFKGKTSTITKEGLTALIQSSQIPVSKRSDSPELQTFEESRIRKTPPPFLPSAYSTQHNSNNLSSSNQRQSPIKYPTTWPAVDSSPNQGFVLANIKPHRPIMTHNNTPLTFKDDIKPYWNNRVANSEAEPKLTPSLILGGLVRNSKSQFNDYLPNITGIDEKSQHRSKSTIRERPGVPEDYFDGKIRPSYNDIDTKSGYRPLVQKQSLRRISPMKGGILRSQGILNTENNESFTQNQMEALGSGMRRAITHRELKSNEIYNEMRDRRSDYQDQAQRTGEGMIAQLVEANVVKYLDSIYGMMEQSKGFRNRVGSYQDVESITEQKGNWDVNNQRKDLKSGPIQKINSSRDLSSTRQRKERENKQEIRVKFKNIEDILDQVKSHPEYKPYRSNSNQPNVKDYVEEVSKEGSMSPFRRLTKSKLTKNIES